MVEPAVFVYSTDPTYKFDPEAMHDELMRYYHETVVPLQRVD